MNRHAWSVLSPTLIGSIVLLAMPSAGAAEFAADLVRSADGDDPEVSKVYIKGDLRREEVMDEDDIGAISITRPDKGVAWTLMPDDKMYMAMPLAEDVNDTNAFMQRLDQQGTMKSIGKENLSGFECEVREYYYGNTGQRAVKMWYATSLEFPLKIVQTGPSGNLTMEYTNIEVKTLPDSMFEIPADFEKFAIPGMSQMPPGMPQFPEGG